MSLDRSSLLISASRQLDESVAPRVRRNNVDSLDHKRKLRIIRDVLSTGQLLIMAALTTCYRIRLDSALSNGLKISPRVRISSFTLQDTMVRGV